MLHCISVKTLCILSLVPSDFTHLFPLVIIGSLGTPVQEVCIGFTPIPIREDEQVQCPERVALRALELNQMEICSNMEFSCQSKSEILWRPNCYLGLSNAISRDNLPWGLSLCHSYKNYATIPWLARGLLATYLQSVLGQPVSQQASQNTILYM